MQNAENSRGQKYHETKVIMTHHNPDQSPNLMNLTNVTTLEWLNLGWPLAQMGTGELHGLVRPGLTPWLRLNRNGAICKRHLGTSRSTCGVECWTLFESGQRKRCFTAVQNLLKNAWTAFFFLCFLGFSKMKKNVTIKSENSITNRLYAMNQNYNHK